MSYAVSFENMNKKLIQFLAYLITTVLSHTAMAVEPLTIGIMHENGIEQNPEHWTPLAQYLSAHIPDHSFKIKSIYPHELQTELTGGKIDFLLTDPGNLIIAGDALTSISTLEYNWNGKTYAATGSVIFTRSNRQDINQLKDLTDKSIAATRRDSLESYQIAWKELSDIGIDLDADIKEIRFSGDPQEKVVYAILNNKSDAGVVSLGLLEQMIKSGKISGSDIKILNPIALGDTQLTSSFKLYPGWSFAKAKHVPDKVAKLVAQQLLRMDPENPAAKAVHIGGWTLAQDYKMVHDLFKRLQIGPYKLQEKVSLARAVRDYWEWSILLAFIVLLPYIRTYRIKHDLLLRTESLALMNNDLQSEISKHKLIEEALFQEKERAQVTLYSIGEAVITTDAEGKIDYLNPIAERLTNWKSKEAQGRKLPEVFRLVDENTRIEKFIELSKYISGDFVSGLIDYSLLINKSSQEIAIEDTIATIKDRTGQFSGLVIVFQDITQTRQMAHMLSYHANHDSVTELLNRRGFERCLEKLLLSARAERAQHALCYIDLDNFKLINDTCGHIAGDDLIRQLPSIFQLNIRNSDVLSRLGGDEFAVLLEYCPIQKAEQIAEELRKNINDFRFIWQGRTYEISASIGVVEITAASESPASILSAADVACFAAKDLGRNRVHVYRETDVELARRHGEMQWVSRITQAHSENRFVLYSQSIISLNPSRLEERHFEILIRMLDEDGEIVPPGAFLPAAERYNLMPTIDRWVINKTFESIKQIIENQPDAALHTVSINLSGASIGDDSFLKFIHEQFNKHQIPPEIICFEITETTAIANLSEAISFIKALKKLGCRFSLDDFGSGLSSFTYLKNLPVDYLKIDGSFIKDMLDDTINSALVESINQIGHVMGIKTIAEFVETEAIATKLRLLGVDYAQGFGISKPKPLHTSKKTVAA